jgi:hypothetical protein
MPMPARSRRIFSAANKLRRPTRGSRIWSQARRPAPRLTRLRRPCLLGGLRDERHPQDDVRFLALFTFSPDPTDRIHAKSATERIPTMSGPLRCATCFGSIEAEFGIDCFCGDNDPGLVWRPIETAPSGDVLVYRPQMPARDRIAVRRVADWCGLKCCPSAQPTHWMPLPDEPKADEGKSSDARFTPVDEHQATGSAEKETTTGDR